ncbi:MAG TPA: SDR family NAD(P)-dependent oxidoreductase, partial [Patescibacteria group bacterium]|nr:SDR family NAD(P)-dependent oxidoreductase [Patescibacteria group bacterium]
FPSAPAYSASKAAVRVWGEGLRGWLAPSGVGVTVICPGFVKSRITARNRFPMPFLMEAAAAARIMRRGIDANKARIAYPWIVAAAMIALAALPPGWTDRLLRRLPGKE